MKRFATIAFALTLALAVSACDDDSPSNPSASNTVRFNSVLLPSNEVPPVTNADQSASGTVVVTLNLTRDSSQNITAATADFIVNLTGFPNATSLTAAHIHPGVAGVNGGQIVNLQLSSGEFVLANGAVSFTKSGINVNPPDVAQQIINNPAAFYFNVHTTLNGGGAVRGQLNAVQ